MQSNKPAAAVEPKGVDAVTLDAVDRALKAAMEDPRMAETVALALLPHMPSLWNLSSQGMLTAEQQQQLEHLTELQNRQAQMPNGANSTVAAADAGSRRGSVATQGPSNGGRSSQTRTPITGTSTLAHSNGAPSAQPYPYQSQEEEERQQLRMSIQRMAYEMDPDAVLEPDVEELLIDAVHDFVKATAEFGSRLARHRGSDALSVRDLQLYLERHVGIRIPGFATEDTRLPHSDLPPSQPQRIVKGRKG